MKKTLSHILPALGLACGLSQAHAAVLPDPVFDTQIQAAGKTESIVLAGGCFWGVQAVFQHVKGVHEAISGYAGGDEKTARYDAVSAGSTDHAEAVKVTYDPAVVSVGKLLKVFFSVAHDPTQRDRQGPDVGSQYRSEIFFTVPEQEKVARDYIAQLDTAKIFSTPIVTKISSLQAFYTAEDYHQNYAALHPNSSYIIAHDAPKLVALKKTLPDLYVEK